MRPKRGAIPLYSIYRRTLAERADDAIKPFWRYAAHLIIGVAFE
ncbi:hypothetical protein P3T24_003183 [Paraburkholderia sp. GAS33]